MSRLNFPVAVLPPDNDGACALQRAESANGIDSVLLEQLTDASRMPVNDLALAPTHRFHVNRNVIRKEAEPLAVQGGLVDLGEMQQRLRRYAAHMQAGAA